MRRLAAVVHHLLSGRLLTLVPRGSVTAQTQSPHAEERVMEFGLFCSGERMFSFPKDCFYQSLVDPSPPKS